MGDVRKLKSLVGSSSSSPLYTRHLRLSGPPEEWRAPLQGFVDDVQAMVSAVPQMLIKDIDSVGSPDDLVVDLGKAPAAVWLGKIFKVDVPNSAITSATSLHWEPTISGFRVLTIPGLDASTKYRLSFVALMPPPL